MKRKVCIATGTRAEWGLLSGIARELASRDDIELQLLVTNMHLSDRYGHTVDEIIADGFKVDAEVPMLNDNDDDSAAATVRSMSRCMAGTADALSRLSPDLLVVLGDRYEMLTVASSALIFRIPIVHIAGGEISEGAYDDSIRHAITKMASLHLTATEENRNRVIQMGEEPQRVINTGAIGVYNIIHEPVMSREELEESIGMTVDRNTLLVTYHPATLDPTPVNQQCAALLEALDRFPDNNVIITYPNSDTAGQVIIDMIERYAATRQHRVKVVPSLGKRRYLSALHYAGAVVGNSSSGIVEVPSMHIPTVDIGIRQRGRLAASSVRHYSCTPDDIARGIAYSLSEEGRNEAAVAENPYAKPDTLRLIVDAIANTPLSELSGKKFHDIHH